MSSPVWQPPYFEALRLGFEVTLYVATR
ncbi:pyrroloquinoline quinone precursor peptide PqqA [Plasticicumulans acidivorans]